MRRKGDDRERFYWDSCAFLAWLLPEEERVPSCREVIESAEIGECVLVTSALTLTEVIKLKGNPPLKEDQEKKIRLFFENDYIIVRQVDRFIAEDARRLIWEHGIKPKDSIHLATALRTGLDEVHTFDGELIDLSGSIGDKKLRICRPAARQRRIATAETDEETSPEV